jgi:ABC-type nitrate/sulfonate/bicarbonate transport system substrate-binding protein
MPQACNKLTAVAVDPPPGATMTDVLATGYAVGYARAMDAGDIVHLATQVWGVSALMTAEPIESLAELAGGTVYAPFEGSPIDIYLKEALEAESLTDSITIAYAPFPQAAALLTEGRAAAAVLVEPIASRLEITGAAHRFENIHDGWARIADGERRSPQVSVVVHENGIDGTEGRLNRMVRRLEVIVARVIADPATYAARYETALGFPAPVLERALSNTLFDTPSESVTRRLIAEYSAITGAAEPPEAFFFQPAR